VGQRNHVLDGGSDTFVGRGNFDGGKGHPIVKYRDTLRSCLQKRLNRSTCCLGCGLGCAQEIVLDGVQIPHGQGIILGKGAPIVNYRDFLP